MTSNVSNAPNHSIIQLPGKPSRYILDARLSPSARIGQNSAESLHHPDHGDVFRLRRIKETGVEDGSMCRLYNILGSSREGGFHATVEDGSLGTRKTMKLEMPESKEHLELDAVKHLLRDGRYKAKIHNREGEQVCQLKENIGLKGGANVDLPSWWPWGIFRNPSSDDYWRLGDMLLRGGIGEDTVNIGGRCMAAPDCYAKALELGRPELSSNYITLGFALNRGDTVRVGNQEMTKVGCYVKALELDSEDIHAYQLLGGALNRGDTVRIGDHDITKADCYAKLLEFFPEDFRLYESLGNALDRGDTVCVRDREMTKVDCYAKALELGPELALNYNSLGFALDRGDTVRVGNREMTKRDCYLKALELNYESFEIYKELGDILETVKTVYVIKGQPITKRLCCLKALEWNPKSADVYISMGDTLNSSETVEVGNQEMTKRGCYLKALELDPANSEAQKKLWNLEISASKTSVLQQVQQQEEVKNKKEKTNNLSHNVPKIRIPKSDSSGSIEEASPFPDGSTSGLGNKYLNIFNILKKSNNEGWDSLTLNDFDGEVVYGNRIDESFDEFASKVLKTIPNLLTTKEKKAIKENKVFEIIETLSRIKSGLKSKARELKVFEPLSPRSHSEEHDSINNRILNIEEKQVKIEEKIKNIGDKVENLNFSTKEKFKKIKRSIDDSFEQIKSNVYDIESIDSLLSGIYRSINQLKESKVDKDIVAVLEQGFSVIKTEFNEQVIKIERIDSQNKSIIEKQEEMESNLKKHENKIEELSSSTKAKFKVIKEAIDGAFKQIKRNIYDMESIDNLLSEIRHNINQLKESKVDKDVVAVLEQGLSVIKTEFNEQAVKISRIDSQLFLVKEEQEKIEEKLKQHGSKIQKLDFYTKHKINEIKNSIDVYLDQIKNNTYDMESVDRRLSEIQNNIEQLKSNKVDKDVVAVLEQGLRGVKTEFNEQAVKISRIDSLMFLVKEKHEKVEIKLKQHGNKIKDLNSSTEEKINEIKKSIDSAFTQIKSYINDIESVNGFLSEIRNNIEQLNEKKVDKDIISVLEQSVNVIQAELDEQSGKIIRVDSTTKNILDKQEKMEEKLSKHGDKVQKLNSSTKEKFDEIKITISDALDQIKSNTNDIKGTARHLSKIQNEIDQLKSNQIDKDVIDALEQGFKAIKAEHDKQAIKKQERDMEITLLNQGDPRARIFYKVLKMKLMIMKAGVLSASSGQVKLSGGKIGAAADAIGAAAGMAELATGSDWVKASKIITGFASAIGEHFQQLDNSEKLPGITEFLTDDNIDALSRKAALQLRSGGLNLDNMTPPPRGIMRIFRGKFAGLFNDDWIINRLVPKNQYWFGSVARRTAEDLLDQLANDIKLTSPTPDVSQQFKQYLGHVTRFARERIDRGHNHKEW